MKALILPQRPGHSGNLLWFNDLPTTQKDALADGLKKLRTLGYFASAFPEGDGVTFSNDQATPEQAHADIAASLPFLDIALTSQGDDFETRRDAILGDLTVACRYLTPVEGMRLTATLEAGITRIHPPVDGEDITLHSHPWGQTLCDEPGADVMDGWTPWATKTKGDAELLGYPLIEREISIPARLLHAANSSVQGQEQLIAYIIEDADSTLDPIRVNRCSWSRLEQIPNKAGWIGEFAYAYVEPGQPQYRSKVYGAKAHPVRVSCNWLGLEIDETAQWDIAPFSDILDGDRSDEMALAVRSALRTAGRAFYLGDPEAAFLSLIYALDGLCDPGKLQGLRHRLWIIAGTKPTDGDDFEGWFDTYCRSYEVRNRLVHGGKTFATLGETAATHIQTLLALLMRTLEVCVVLGPATRAQFVEHVIAQMERPELDATIQTLITAKSETGFSKSLVQGDPKLTKVKTLRSTGG